jgi:hypothetical protein
VNRELDTDARPESSLSQDSSLVMKSTSRSQLWNILVIPILCLVDVSVHIPPSNSPLTACRRRPLRCGSVSRCAKTLASSPFIYSGQCPQSSVAHVPFEAIAIHLLSSRDTTYTYFIFPSRPYRPSSPLLTYRCLRFLGYRLLRHRADDRQCWILVFDKIHTRTTFAAV